MWEWWKLVEVGERVRKLEWDALVRVEGLCHVPGPLFIQSPSRALSETWKL